MVHVPMNKSTENNQRVKSIYISQKVEGTPRYCAPESWVFKQYSCQSDVWQAGCCLYSMLSGYSPFLDEPEMIIEGLYCPMDGEGWDNISEIAKDLIRKMLVVDPLKRLTTQQILSHEWLRGSAPENKLDMNYLRRIKKLEIATQLKGVFLNQDIQKTCEMQRQYLINTLPYLFRNNSSTSPTSSQSKKKKQIYSKRTKRSFLSSSCPHSPSEEIQKPSEIEQKSPNDSMSSSFEEDLYFYQKLKLLRTGLFYAITPSTHTSETFDDDQPSTLIRVKRYLTSENTELYYTHQKGRQLQKEKNGNNGETIKRGEEMKWKISKKSKTDTNVLTRTGRVRSQSRVMNGNGNGNGRGMNWDGIDLSQITYENFLLLLKKVDLSQLATREIFDIFDREHTGNFCILFPLSLSPHAYSIFPLV